MYPEEEYKTILGDRLENDSFEELVSTD